MFRDTRTESEKLKVEAETLIMKSKARMDNTNTLDMKGGSEGPSYLYALDKPNGIEDEE